MKYCCHCAAALVVKVPPGDNRERHVCEMCGTVHYRNPRIVAGCIPEWEGRVLLCRRGIEPRYGSWTLPAGFMETAETALEAAVRETEEEANARVEALDLYALFNLPHIDQVCMMFRARLLDLDFSPGEETIEVELFDTGRIPWKELAFPTVHHTLRLYLEDLRAGRFPLRMGDIVRQADRTELFVPRRPAATRRQTEEHDRWPIRCS